jgi:ribosomal-protein-alanine N-acetyltransferase
MIAPIETERLFIRPVSQDDASSFCAMMTPGVSRWLANWPSPLLQADAMARIEAMKRAMADQRAMPMSIVRKQDGALTGWISLSRDAADSNRGDLSFWLGEAHQGAGVMRESLSHVIQAGFARFGLSIIEAGAQVANASSFNVMRSCGMRRVREAMVFAPSRGQMENCHFYEIGAPRVEPGLYG